MMSNTSRNHSGASIDQITRACNALAEIGRVPEQLKFEWMRSNGFWTDVVEVYSTDSILERNAEYETKRYCPGYLVIANDFGSRIALLDTRHDFGNVLLSYAGTMKVDSFEDTKMSLEFWIDNNCKFELRDFPTISAVEPVCLRLDSLPTTGLKGLLRIKSLAKLEIGIADLKEIGNNLPFVLCNTSYIKGVRLAAEINTDGNCVSLWTTSDPQTPLSLVDPFD